MHLLSLLADPSAWAALGTLVLVAIVLGIDSLIFIAILSNKLPAQARARRIDLLLTLAFRVMIGSVLFADGFGVHIPKGYIYAAMGFSVFVELLNIIERNHRTRSRNAA
jgi:predicted tellurium resistance membrane protein TerC